MVSRFRWRQHPDVANEGSRNQCLSFAFDKRRRVYVCMTAKNPVLDINVVDLVDRFDFDRSRDDVTRRYSCKKRNS